MLVDPIAQPTVYYGGVGIDVDANSKQIDLDPATVASIAGAIQESQRNLANGFAGLDSQSAIDAIVKVQYMTRDQANAQVLPQGVLAVISDSKALRFGDGVTNGGFVAGLGTENCLYVSPVGTTAVENAQVVMNTYEIAKTMLVYGGAPTATQRLTILLGFGSYDFTGLPVFYLTNPYIDIVGISQQGVRVNPWQWQIPATNTDVVIRNMTFTAVGFWQIQYDDLPKTVTFENLVWEGPSTSTVFQSIVRTGSGVVPPRINWNLRNIKAPANLCMGSSAATGMVYNFNADNVEGYNKLFANSVAGTKVTITGRIANSKFLGTSALHFDTLAPLQFWNCEWAQPMNYLTTGVRLEYVRFKPAAGVASLAGASVGQSCFVAHCSLALTTHATTPITNTAGATDAAACNVRSDGV